MLYTFTKYYSKNRERKTRKSFHVGKMFQLRRNDVTVNQRPSHVTTLITNSNVKKVTEIMGHDSQLIVQRIAEALNMNTDSLRKSVPQWY
jgi:hypothetical protein